jgi:hypothetical protein
MTNVSLAVDTMNGMRKKCDGEFSLLNTSSTSASCVASAGECSENCPVTLKNKAAPPEINADRREIRWCMLNP